MYRSSHTPKNAWFLFICVLTASLLFPMASAVAQVSATSYSNGNCINDIVIQDNYVWAATTGSLVRWNKADGTYRQYTENDGLASYLLSCIEKDAQGNLWIGTMKGVQRFDGATFTTYNASNSGLTNDTVNALAVANDGTIWVGTEGGLSRFDGTAWTCYTTENSAIASNYISSIAVGSDGVVWVAHNEYGNYKGVSSFDGTTWNNYTNANSGLGINPVISIGIDANNTKWFGTSSKLYSFDGKTWSGKAILYANDINLDSNGVLWVASGFMGNNSKATYSLSSYNGLAWTDYPLAKNLDYPIMLYKCSLIDTDGSIWFVTEEYYGSMSLHRYDGTTVKTYYTDGPLNYTFRGIAIDKTNRKWFATDFGLSCYDGKTWENHLFSLTFDGISAPRNLESMKSFVNMTRGVVVDQDNVVWTCSCWGYNVMSYDGTAWKNYNGVTDASFKSNGGVITYDILVDKENVKWFVGLGITSYDGKNWAMYKLNDIYAIAGAVDNDNVKWFCTLDEGIWSFDGTTWTNYSGSNSPVAGMVSAVTVDKNNVKWFLATDSLTDKDTSTEKIYSFDGVTWNVYGSDVTGISTDYTMDNFYVDNNNVLWVAHKYLTSFDGTTWKTWTDVKAGTESAIAFDTDGYMWLASRYSVGDGGTLSALKLSTGPTSVEESVALPVALELRGNYPNPFNPSTIIAFNLPAFGVAKLSVYNITGQKVRDLVNGPLSAGSHSIVWDGRDASGQLVSSGVYLTRLSQGSHATAGRMLLAK